MAKRIISMHQQYGIGSLHLPGLGKLVEEMGEANVEIGKVQGLGHMGKHWDGHGVLKTRLENELADVQASILYAAQHNGLNTKRMEKRVQQKLERFNRWHDNVRAGRDPNDDGKKAKKEDKKK